MNSILNYGEIFIRKFPYIFHSKMKVQSLYGMETLGEQRCSTSLVPTADRIGRTYGDSYRKRVPLLQTEKCQLDYGKLRWWSQHSSACPQLGFTSTVRLCRVWECVHTTMASNKTQLNEKTSRKPHRTCKLIRKRNKQEYFPTQDQAIILQSTDHN